MAYITVRILSTVFSQYLTICYVSILLHTRKQTIKLTSDYRKTYNYWFIQRYFARSDALKSRYSLSWAILTKSVLTIASLILKRLHSIIGPVSNSTSIKWGETIKRIGQHQILCIKKYQQKIVYILCFIQDKREGKHEFESYFYGKRNRVI